MTEQFISYIRVSTNQQGDSKLGIEAQRRINLAYIQSISGHLFQEEVEIQSGIFDGRISIKKSLSLEILLKNRPILKKTIDLCEQKKLTLLVKDLSRLGRHTLLINYLISSGVKFICADAPLDSAFMLQIKATLAEEEARLISQRTIEALKSKKEQGTKLGTPNPEVLKKGRIVQAKIKRENAKNNYTKNLSIILKLREQGLSYTKIAEKLNEFGIQTIQGHKFYGNTIKRILDRYYDII